MPLFAESYLCLEGCQLTLIGGCADAVKTTFTNKETCAGIYSLYHLRQILLPSVCQMPWMQPRGGYGLFPFRQRMMRVEIQISSRMIHVSKMKLLRHRIIAIAAPGMTTEDPANGQIQSLQCSMTLNSLHRILRTSGREATRGRCQRAYTPLIEANGQDEELSEQDNRFR